MIMLRVGGCANHIVDNVGKPPCSCRIFQHYLRQIHAFVLAEFTDNYSQTEQLIFCCCKSIQFLCNYAICFSHYGCHEEKSLQNVQRKVIIDEFTFLCTFL